jgi:hypothetical protein
MKRFTFAAGLLGAFTAVTALRAQTSQPPTVADITRLLQGMEVPGGAVVPYDVVAFDEAGKTSVFASHR